MSMAACEEKLCELFELLFREPEPEISKEKRLYLDTGEGGKKSYFCADWYLCNGKDELAVEIERCQKHPSTNVLKYWLLMETGKVSRLTLLHVICPKNDAGVRIELAKQCGQWMASRPDDAFTYISLDLRKDAKNGPSSAPDKISHERARQIGNVLCSEADCPKKKSAAQG